MSRARKILRQLEDYEQVDMGSAYPSRAGKTTRLLINPSKGEVKGLIRETEKKMQEKGLHASSAVIRGVSTSSGKHYMWNGYDANHSDMADMMQESGLIEKGSEEHRLLSRRQGRKMFHVKIEPRPWAYTTDTFKEHDYAPHLDPSVPEHMI